MKKSILCSLLLFLFLVGKAATTEERRVIRIKSRDTIDPRSIGGNTPAFAYTYNSTLYVEFNQVEEVSLSVTDREINTAIYTEDAQSPSLIAVPLPEGVYMIEMEIDGVLFWGEFAL